MSSFRLLISIVPHDKGEKLTRAAMESGCRGGTVLMGRGLARSNFMAVLGLGESTKDVIMMIVEEDVLESVRGAIIASTSHEQKNFGELFCTDVDALMKGGKFVEGEKGMAGNSNELITVIVNRGYADDVMAAARKAGAGGGTVLNARGTARETDERFFGMHIVPEKEMLLIVVEADKKEAVLEAVKNLSCLNQPGIGIAFCSPADEFTILGKK
ncbi:P-II family nitrogen regulator [Treponema sp.]|uniref:P-II family nitrogen regulator n=1 Tax=Treponema sp. TaxID=166 RepID=UPI0025DA2C1D|nr:P-II family nitrogen regulator [Treponema sp.]MCR5217452.1 transcriptional regulator [Treponema sp.]